METSRYIQRGKRPENLFALDPLKAALVIVDMQNFSCAPTTGDPLPRISEVVGRINRLAAFCREMGIPVIWICHNITTQGGFDDAGLYALFHDREMVQRVMNHGKGTEIYSDMHFDLSRDHIVFKNRYSAFLSNPPELRERLDSLKRRQLMVAGVAANVCVESTVMDAMQLDYEVVLVSDGVTTTDDVSMDCTLTNIRLFFGDVRTTEDIMRALSKGFVNL